VTTLTVVEAQPEMLLNVKALNDKEVTLDVLLSGNGAVQARTPKIQSGWFDEGEIKLSFEADNCYRETFEIKDEFGQTNTYQYVFDFRKEVPAFLPKISSNASGEIDFGKTLKLTSAVETDYTGELKYYWKEWNGNPTKNALLTPNEKDTDTTQLLPGVYYFSLYVSDGKYLSLPATIRVKVSGYKGLLYSANGPVAFFLNDAQIASDKISCVSEPNGTFASDSTSVTYQRLDSKTAHLTLSQDYGYFVKPVRIIGANWTLISGTVVTNFPWGEGPMEGVIVTAINKAMYVSTTTDANGAFAIFMPENAGPTTLTFAKQNCAFEPVIVTETSTLKVVPEKSTGNSNSYLYLTVIDKESSFFLEGVTVNCFGITGHTNSKGVTSNISAPKGENSVIISMDGYDTVATNFAFAGTSTMRKVALSRTQGRRADSLDVIVRDTDAKLVQADQFRLVSSTTSSIIVNYANEVSPLLSIPTKAGQKVIIRAQKEGYDNFSETLVLDNYISRDIVFIPEPMSLTIAAILLALAIRNRKQL
ncbi:hypothetical protein IKS73_03720, partial [bacterium]|nr:hypothetical protein [bacterium]